MTLGDLGLVICRVARRDDLSAILALLADDDVARARSGYVEEPTPEVLAAFEEIQSDHNNELLVAEVQGRVIGTLQLTFLPGLSRGGMRRAQVEGMRVRSDLRNRGMGQRLMDYAIHLAQQRGCGLMQLTTDLRREDAHRFYLRHGFEATHAGMKRLL